MFACMRSAGAFAGAVVLLAVLLLVHVGTGPLDIPLLDAARALAGMAGPDGTTVAVVRGIRLPGALTALLVGGALACCGAVMQTLFANPLAGPSVLGVSSGAALGAALVLLVPGLAALPAAGADAALVLAAFVGACAVLATVVLADRRLGDGVTLLILGLMVGYLCSAVVSVLEAAAAERALRGFVLWGMGSFAGVGPARLPWLIAPIAAGLALAMAHVRSLNALLLGDTYARTMGVDVRRTRSLLILATGLLAGTATAFCGPIAFLGLATPHLVRAAWRTADHRIVLPASILLGAVLALGCDLVVRRVDGLPLNAVTALVGAPVVVWLLLSGSRFARMDA